ncbi:hypothetical protein B484DRAFT_153623 [Ochromonadaceae sp. CCMP2298]|nr:hypothetical protein B484DRAFT_153623 [Ochromonadaceae sp. CCMP2298]|mmetsp:Transcript_5719/g.12587  ORF Transcript_5719/g.12587 Transcript_5719/m.12587 type:complete len:388 (-) Transcript_5719:51-1214(-)
MFLAMRLVLLVLLSFAWTEAFDVTEGFHHHANETTDVSSLEFKEIARKTYSKVLPCVEGAWMYSDKKPTIDWQFPDDAQQHFEEILRVTEPYRQVSVHEYAGYEGPWIENMFISKFMHLPLHRYRGMIPIFVQWIDSQILRGRLFGNLNNALNGVLRPNVLYLAISQGDAGLSFIGTSHPNILVMSAGGFGHIPIPLIKGELPLQPHPENFDFDLGFYGNPRQHPREEMLPFLRQRSGEMGLKYNQAQGGDWLHDMNRTKYNLAPRGYGRSSFRFAECIQMGRMPVFIYDDMPWIPFMSTNLSLETFGFVMRKSNDGQENLEQVLSAIKNTTEPEYREKLVHLLSIRSHFTYRGVFRQIMMFLHDPFGADGGHLRCTYHARNQFCCG